jgi:hypothetical protein
VKLSPISARGDARNPFEQPAKKRRVFVTHIPADLIHRRMRSFEPPLRLFEPFAHDRVEENLNTVGRLYYSASTTLCCAHSLSEDGAAALGAQAGEARLASVFKKAGFGEFRRTKSTSFNLILEAKV